ncbi:thioredoxin-dependent thiol peroxidase [Paenibacillus radicis (ex Gao et al. 2016)]|uniref:thioredoxin-dependent peroxiredoxin n=1 Tax=Paenibacillus radicis (ex Gao et al. 2016) TaxID=1737354 RepID=A0A917HBF5_9BACL|nr:thioredoxin-dependent thiol peroxidase [Paenibacillus radicis (ex Gao et al. 2016)]GGG73937.1 peroxiredoxin [Paenibacillus radicis (ex Gao et al. 2016)]
MTQVQIGQEVPDFTLPASTGQAVSLKDYRGKKRVIYFYPKDMTPGCTTESCDFRDYNGQFETYNTAVIGISPDDLASHDEFIAKHELPFPLLSDTEHEVSELFGVWKLRSWNGTEFMGIERSTFLIDENGVLAKEWRVVNVDGHVQEVLEAAKQG